MTFDNGLFSADFSFDNDNYDNHNKLKQKTYDDNEIAQLQEKMAEDSFEKIREVGSKNPDSLINFISFDFDYDGQTHKSDYMFGRQKEYQEFIKKLADGKIQKGCGRVHVFYGDVFGGFSEKEDSGE